MRRAGVSVALQLLVALALHPAGALAACGVIPITHVTYAGDELKLESDVEVNGVAASQGTTGADSTLDPDGSRGTDSPDLPDLDPETFPANASNVDADETDAPFVVTDEQFWDKIEIGNNQTASFSGGGTFHIDELTVKNGGTLNLAAGTYFIRKFKLEQLAELVVTSPGVRLHIGEEADIQQQAEVNVGGGPRDLFVSLHSGSQWKTKQNVDFVGVIYGPAADDVKLEKNNTFRGVLVTGGAVEVKRDTDFTLTPADQAALVGTTTCPGPTDLLIAHDGAGIHCVAEPVQVTALDAAGNPVLDYAGQVEVDTGVGSGTWSLLSGSGTLDAAGSGPGSAYYTFDPSDMGTVQLGLDYPSGPASLDIDAALTDNPAVGDDDSEGALVFSASGFTVTASALPNPPPALINDPLPTATAGISTAFTVHLAAFGQRPGDADCGVIETYAGTRSLAFWTDHLDPVSGTRTLVVDGAASSSGAPGAVQDVTFTAGQASVSVYYRDAGQVQLAVRDATSAPAPLDGASNAFVVRPADLVVSAVEDAAGMPNPGTGSVDGTPFVAAGEAFTVTVDAVDADGGLLPNFGNESSAETLRVDSSALVVPASGGRNGSMGGTLGGGTGFVALGTGRFRASAVVFDEVGSIRLRAVVADGDYLGTGPLIGSASGVVGRFHPADVVLASGSVSAACNGLTWMDQAELGVAYTLQAITTAGAVTENFDQTLLGLAGTGSAVPVLENADAGVDLSARLSGVAAGWSLGQVALTTATASVARGAAVDGPFDSLQLGVRLLGAPAGVALTAPDMLASASGDCVAAGSCDAVAVGATTSVRYGRLQVLPTFGPETSALDLPLEAQGWDGSRWTRDARDSCSAYSGADASLSSFTGALDPGETAVSGPAASTGLVAGSSDPSAPLLLSAPGTGNTGTVELLLDVFSYLEFDWDGDGSADDPTATATFGIHRGHDAIIYWRETP